MQPWKALPALLFLLAGCASTTPGSSTGDGSGLEPTKPFDDIWTDVRTVLADVPCEASYTGTATSTENLLLLSAISIPTEQEGTIHAELDIGGDLAVHARYGTSGFELYDIRDPLAPVVIGNWTYTDEDGEPINAGALDVKFLPDNKTVIVGAGDGIQMVDVSDVGNMRLLSFWHKADATGVIQDPANDFVSYNPHMLYSKRIADADWVFMAPNANSGVWILKVEGEGDARHLTYVTQTLPVEGGPLGPHDMWVGTDELTGNEYLYSADGFHGWTVFDVSDPTTPTPVGGLFNPAELAYTHTLQAATINGKRIVATIGEVGVNFLRIYDATILAAPILLGVYQAETLPEGTNAPAPTNPQHNLNIVGGKLYFAYYSFGMYVFDLEAVASQPSLPLVQTATLTPAAHYAVGVEPTRGPTAFTGFWDVVLKDGVIYVSHIEGGLVVLGYGCNTELPNVALTSTG
ncbi:MAG: hypothetical protein AABX89_06185 [Candidatus Thermoplasmatota archaeon]